ncbi:MAG TPA: hypothetical protein VF627_04715 [Abditibacterium sp.]|jgi:type II secretory pathway component GspD/PulD (secretin)
MKSIRVAAALAASVVVGGGFSSAVYAQVEAPAAQAPNVTKAIRLKNVSPSIVAWLLDPVNHPEPVEFRALRQASANAEAPKKAVPGAFALPKGVKTMSAIDAQNALMVLGTEAGIAELEETIQFLDKPLRQVEIEAQFIEIDEAGVKELGFDFGADGPAGIDFSLRRGTGEETLKALVAKGRAKVLVNSRKVTFNNVEASVNVPVKRPVVLGYRDENGKFQEFFDPAAQAPAAGLQIGVAIQLSVTPTINNDDTVTVLMSATQVLEMSGKANLAAAQRDLGGVASILNVGAGETAALRGLSSRFLATFGKLKPNSTVLMLVTPRILRRVGDE